MADDAAQDERIHVSAKEEQEIRQDILLPRVQRRYTYVFENMQLSAAQEEALLAMMVDESFARTVISMYAVTYDNQLIDEEHRLRRLTDIVGDDQTDRFLELESRLRSFKMALQMNSILKPLELEMSDVQQEKMIALIEQVHSDYLKPVTAAQPGSWEHAEKLLEIADDKNRMVMELASAVLTAEQVRRLHEEYESRAYNRTAFLEHQKRIKEKDPDASVVPAFPVNQQ